MFYGCVMFPGGNVAQPCFFGRIFALFFVHIVHIPRDKKA